MKQPTFFHTGVHVLPPSSYALAIPLLADIEQMLTVRDKMLQELVIHYDIHFLCNKIIVTRICRTSTNYTSIERDFFKIQVRNYLPV